MKELVTKDYYANEHGYQLYDYLDAKSIHLGHLYTLAEGFYLYNIVKYVHRAGKKDNNSYESDTKKVSDYADLLIRFYKKANMVAGNKDAIITLATSFAREFDEFDGEL